MSLVTGLFFLVLLLNQLWSPRLRLQVSHCSTFRIMCDVPSIAVFCSESIECFPGVASKFFLKLLVTIPVAPVITGILLLLLLLFSLFNSLVHHQESRCNILTGQSRIFHVLKTIKVRSVWNVSQGHRDGRPCSQNIHKHQKVIPQYRVI
jgi:hypothetical protein